MQVGQGKSPVPAEDGDARGAETSPPEVAVLGREGTHAGPTVTGRSSGVMVIEAGPELVAHVFELVEQLDAALMAVHELPIEPGELVQQAAALEMAGVTPRAGQAGGGSHDDGRTAMATGPAVGCGGEIEGHVRSAFGSVRAEGAGAAECCQHSAPGV